MIEHNTVGDSPLEDEKVSDKDLSIILGRNLKNGMPLSDLDLKNCSVTDLINLAFLVRQELELRLPQVVGEVAWPIHAHFEKSELLTGQLNLKDDALTVRQIALLTAIKAQLDRATDDRVDEAVKTSRLAFDRAFALEDSYGSQLNKFHDAIKQEYGENNGIRLSGLVLVADDVNAEPTENSWGNIKVTLNDGHDAAMAFVRQHADVALEISDRLIQKHYDILHDPENVLFHFSICPTHDYFFIRNGVTPEEVFKRCDEIKRALIKQGGCIPGKEKYALSDFVFISFENTASFDSLGNLTARVDVREPLEKNLAFIRSAVAGQ